MLTLVGTGARLACLVNASVTVCGDDAIYAFGGFDQYTDEGMCFLCVVYGLHQQRQ